MQSYFYRGAYTQQAWTNLIATPCDISEVMKPSIERFGGEIVACFLIMGGGINGAEPGGFVRFPDNAAATAWTLYLTASGLTSRADIVPVLTAEESVDALTRIGSHGTPDPGGNGW